MSQVEPVWVVCEVCAGEDFAHAVVAERMGRVEPALVALAPLAKVGLDFRGFFEL